jgi:FAD/FMN-containing dehydrogenase
MMTSSTADIGNDLEGRVAGPLLRAGDLFLAAEVAPFNRARTPRPVLAVGATGTGDVAATVGWAALRGHRVAVQATGHGLTSSLAGAVLVTTKRMSWVEVDPLARVARAGAGATWAQVIAAAAPHGLMPLAGSSSRVGGVGYTLGGGLGPLGRKYGFAADLVRRMRLVTFEGAVHEVDPEQEPELFWALRGGKGNFGIVTELEFDLVPVTRLYGGGIFFGADAAADVLHAYREWAPTLPDETTSSVALLRLPPLPELPEPLRGRFVVHLRMAHLGPAAEGAVLAAPMRAVAPALLDVLADMPAAALDAIHMEPTEPMPAREQGVTLTGLPAEAVDALLAAAGPDADAPSLIMAEIRQLGGALARRPAVPNAVAGRSAAYSVLAVAPEDGPAAEVVHRLAQWSTGGALLNFLGAATAERIRSLWAPAELERLLAVKRLHDPANVFAHGQPIDG